MNDSTHTPTTDESRPWWHRFTTQEGRNAIYRVAIATFALLVGVGVWSSAQSEEAARILDLIEAVIAPAAALLVSMLAEAKSRPSQVTVAPVPKADAAAVLTEAGDLVDVTTGKHVKRDGDR